MVGDYDRILIKWTPGKTRTTALLGIATAWIIVVAVRGLSHFVLVEADWSVVWANRVLLIVGQQMTEQMTQAPGSESCIAVSNCYGVNQNWRLWWILYPTFAIFASRLRDHCREKAMQGSSYHSHSSYVAY